MWKEVSMDWNPSLSLTSDDGEAEAVPLHSITALFDAMAIGQFLECERCIADLKACPLSHL